MRMVEARARYAARHPRPGEALLGWRMRGTTAEHEFLCPSLESALTTAALLASDPACHAVWVYDGRRLYDAATIARQRGAGPGDDRPGMAAPADDAPHP